MFGARKESELSAARVLDPEERISEVLFGLIMVVTFTGSLSVATARQNDVRSMLVGALGCNVAWGIIDGVFYVMNALIDRERNLQTLRNVRNARDAAQARRLIAGALPRVVAAVLEPSELTTIRKRLLTLPPPPPVARVTARDLLGALGVFLLVFASTLPVALPFLFIRHIPTAMRVSNGAALLMLFVTGFAHGRAVGRPPWRFGIGMVVLGGALVAITIGLGG